MSVGRQGQFVVQFLFTAIDSLFQVVQLFLEPVSFLTHRSDLGLYPALIFLCDPDRFPALFQLFSKLLSGRRTCPGLLGVKLVVFILRGDEKPCLALNGAGAGKPG